MPDKGKKRAAEWCTFCEMGGHTCEECRRWAGCQRDMANTIKAAIKDEWKPQPKAKGHKKARRHHRGGQKVKERTSAPPRLPPPARTSPAPRTSPPPPANPPPPSAPSAEVAGPATSSSLPVDTNTTAQGSPGVEPGLLSRLVQVSQSEAELLVRVLEKIRKEGSVCEDFVENPLVDEPGQESTQGPCEEPEDDGKRE